MSYVVVYGWDCRSLSICHMPYAKMFQLAAQIRATDDAEQKIVLMRELRKLLDEETVRLKVQPIKKNSQSSSK